MEIRTPENNKEWQQYYDLRYQILRAPWGQPRGSERNSEDELAIHLACFNEGEIHGVLRLDTFINSSHAQIRFMAVSHAQQGNGIGKKLMLSAEERAKILGFSGIVLQARENALPFYKSLGYTMVKKTHLLFDSIQHYEMSKTF